jgi:hypothetical protein
MNAAHIRKSLLTALRTHGTQECARVFGISRTSISAFAADLPRRQGTDALIELRAADAFATLEAGGGK